MKCGQEVPFRGGFQAVQDLFGSSLGLQGCREIMHAHPEELKFLLKFGCVFSMHGDHIIVKTLVSGTLTAIDSNQSSKFDDCSFL